MKCRAVMFVGKLFPTAKGRALLNPSITSVGSVLTTQVSNRKSQQLNSSFRGDALFPFHFFFPLLLFGFHFNKDVFGHCSGSGFVKVLSPRLACMCICIHRGGSGGRRGQKSFVPECSGLKGNSANSEPVLQHVDLSNSNCVQAEDRVLFCFIPVVFISVTSGGRFQGAVGESRRGVENEGQIHIKAGRSAFLLHCCWGVSIKRTSEQRAL